MVVLSFGDDAWFIAHPGFSPNPQDTEYLPQVAYNPALPLETNYASTDANPEYFMSYEFATFLHSWDIGDFGPSEFHARNFHIAQRKSCYSEPLLNDFGVFTKAGERVLQKALAYRTRLIRQYESEGYDRSKVPQWYDCTKMDRIVLACPIELKNLLFLKALYNATYPPPSVPKQFEVSLPDDIEFEYQTYELPRSPYNPEPKSRVYLMTGALRPYPHRRRDFELLVKLGLVELHKLPKPIASRGRGRAPMGAYLTESGKKFFEDFRQNYDPQIKKDNERNRMMRGE